VALSRARREGGPLAPDPELWCGLGAGALLRTALEDFYGRAFADPRLAPFFVDVTQDWVAQKQFSFLKSIIVGDASYFGYRPRNAHHWMVISDELFDHRERLFSTCLHAAGVEERWVQRLRRIDESYRKQIVKDAPWPRKLRGEALPLDGYERLELDCGTVCDGCTSELHRGMEVDLHRRTGKVLCPICRAAQGEGRE